MRKYGTYNYLWLIILIFHVKYLKNFACKFKVFGIFCSFSIFFGSNLFIFELKVVGNIWVYFPLISILEPAMEEQNNQL